MTSERSSGVTPALVPSVRRLTATMLLAERMDSGPSNALEHARGRMLQTEALAQRLTDRVEAGHGRDGEHEVADLHHDLLVALVVVGLRLLRGWCGCVVSQHPPYLADSDTSVALGHLCAARLVRAGEPEAEVTPTGPGLDPDLVDLEVVEVGLGRGSTLLISAKGTAHSNLAPKVPTLTAAALLLVTMK